MSEGNQPVHHGYIEVPGARLYYENAGEGKPVVFLHGGLLDSRMWDEQFQVFAQHYQVIRYDMRRSGKSEDTASTEPYMPILYRDLHDLLHTLVGEPATLVGLSGGARVAIDLAIACPELIHKLVLVSPGMSGYEFVDEWTHQRIQELQEAESQGNVAGVVEASMTMWTAGPYRTLEQIPLSIRESIHLMATRAVSQHLLDLEIGELEPSAITRLTEIQAPTLIVLSEKDTSDIHTIGKLLHEHVVGSELVTIADVGHTLTMENPFEFDSLVDQFLRG